MTICIQQKILWLQVTICNTLFMQVLQSHCNLSSIETSTILRETTIGQIVEKFSTIEEIRDKIELCLGLERVTQTISYSIIQLLPIHQTKWTILPNKKRVLTFSHNTSFRQNMFVLIPSINQPYLLELTQSLLAYPESSLHKSFHLLYNVPTYINHQKSTVLLGRPFQTIPFQLFSTIRNHLLSFSCSLPLDVSL